MTTMLYRIPQNTVFESKHGGDRNWEIARDNLVLLAESGSRVTGANIGGDDQDLMGVCIEPPEVMLGMQSFEEYHYRSQPEGECSQEGDIDLNVYSLRKWVFEVTKGNLNYLTPLFAPLDKTLHLNGAGLDLREAVPLFLAKKHHRGYLGYLNSMRKDMEPGRSTRTELVRAYGYDTKAAYHAVRVARQALQILRIGKMVLPMSTEDRNLLTGIRRCHYTHGDMLRMLGKLEAEIVDAAHYSSKLPDEVDFGAVDKWLTSTYLNWWDAKRHAATN